MKATAEEQLANAIDRSDLPAIRKLLDEGAALDVVADSPKHFDLLPLSRAAGIGLAPTRLLIERGADVDDISDRYGALSAALDAELYDVVRLLLKKSKRPAPHSFADRDSDDDGLLDGNDTDWIETAIAALPDSAFKNANHRNAMLALLADAEKMSKKGNVKAARDKLETIRLHVDGCGAVSDPNDWIVDCTVQIKIRALVDVLIANL